MSQKFDWFSFLLNSGVLGAIGSGVLGCLAWLQKKRQEVAKAWVLAQTKEQSDTFLTAISALDERLDKLEIIVELTRKENSAVGENTRSMLDAVRTMNSINKKKNQDAELAANEIALRLTKLTDVIQQATAEEKPPENFGTVIVKN